MIATLPAAPAPAPTDVRPAVVAVGWVPQVVAERDTYYYRWQLAEGRCEDLLAERDRLALLCGALLDTIADQERVAEARLARLTRRPAPSLAARWLGAAALLWDRFWNLFEDEASREGLGA